MLDHLKSSISEAYQATTELVKGGLKNSRAAVAAMALTALTPNAACLPKAANAASHAEISGEVALKLKVQDILTGELTAKLQDESMKAQIGFLLNNRPTLLTLKGEQWDIPNPNFIEEGEDPYFSKLILPVLEAYASCTNDWDYVRNVLESYKQVVLESYNMMYDRAIADMIANEADSLRGIKKAVNAYQAASEYADEIDGKRKILIALDLEGAVISENCLTQELGDGFNNGFTRRTSPLEETKHQISQLDEAGLPWTERLRKAELLRDQLQAAREAMSGSSEDESTVEAGTKAIGELYDAETIVDQYILWAAEQSDEHMSTSQKFTIPVNITDAIEGEETVVGGPIFTLDVSVTGAGRPDTKLEQTDDLGWSETSHWVKLEVERYMVARIVQEGAREVEALARVQAEKGKELPFEPMKVIKGIMERAAADFAQEPGVEIFVGKTTGARDFAKEDRLTYLKTVVQKANGVVDSKQVLEALIRGNEYALDDPSSLDRLRSPEKRAKVERKVDDSEECYRGLESNLSLNSTYKSICRVLGLAFFDENKEMVNRLFKSTSGDFNTWMYTPDWFTPAWNYQPEKKQVYSIPEGEGGPSFQPQDNRKKRATAVVDILEAFAADQVARGGKDVRKLERALQKSEQEPQ